MKINVKVGVAVVCICIAVLLVCLLFFGQRGVFHLLNLQNQFSALDAENKRIAVENERLQEEIELLNENLAYIEDIARKQLGLVKKDELVYKLQPHDGSESGLDGR